MSQDRQQQQSNDVGDLDRRVHGGTCRILVGVADGVTGNRCLVRIGSLQVFGA